MIYFDNAATTFPKPDIVLDYVDWVQRNMAVNVGRGSYKVAKEAMQITDLAKQRMGELVHANSLMLLHMNLIQMKWNVFSR